MNSMPLVSICCITYNHEKFIKECLDGFLAQITSFEVEFLIHDDASTDKTQKIITAKVGNDKRFKLILRKENLKSTGKAIFPILHKKARGRYIAMCEGDDYWTDPLKLQKQVDFLEANEDYGLVHTDADFFFTETGKIVKNFKRSNEIIKSQENVAEEIIIGTYSIYTLTVMFRKDLLKKVDFNFNSNFVMGDLLLWLSLLQFSKFHYINESTSVYRITKGSMSRPKSRLAKINFLIDSKRARLHFAKKLNLSKEIISKAKDDFNRKRLLKAFENCDKIKSKEYFSTLKVKTINDKVFYIASQNRLLNLIVKYFVLKYIIKGTIYA